MQFLQTSFDMFFNPGREFFKLLFRGRSGAFGGVFGRFCDAILEVSLGPVGLGAKPEVPASEIGNVLNRLAVLEF